MDWGHGAFLLLGKLGSKEFDCEGSERMATGSLESFCTGRRNER